MNELHATDNVAYMVALLSIVNALLYGLDDLRRRDRLRKEFIGQGVHRSWGSWVKGFIGQEVHR